MPIEDFAQFQQRFGGLWPDSLLPHAVEQFFEHGGRQAVIVRVVANGRAPTIELPAGGEWLTLTGISPGGHEFLRVSVDHDGIGMQDQDLFNLVVQRVRARGSELVEAQEIFRRVSILPGSARDVTRKLANSQLVRVTGELPRSRPDITRGPDPQRADRLRRVQRRRRRRPVAVRLRPDRFGEPAQRHVRAARRAAFQFPVPAAASAGS